MIYIFFPQKKERKKKVNVSSNEILLPFSDGAPLPFFEWGHFYFPLNFLFSFLFVLFASFEIFIADLFTHMAKLKFINKIKKNSYYRYRWVLLFITAYTILYFILCFVFKYYLYTVHRN